jgi:hypothetical protein
VEGDDCWLWEVAAGRFRPARRTFGDLRRMSFVNTRGFGSRLHPWLQLFRPYGLLIGGGPLASLVARFAFSKSRNWFVLLRLTAAHARMGGTQAVRGAADRVSNGLALAALEPIQANVEGPLFFNAARKSLF